MRGPPARRRQGRSGPHFAVVQRAQPDAETLEFIDQRAHGGWATRGRNRRPRSWVGVCARISGPLTRCVGLGGSAVSALPVEDGRRIEPEGLARREVFSAPDRRFRNAAGPLDQRRDGYSRDESPEKAGKPILLAGVPNEHHLRHHQVQRHATCCRQGTGGRIPLLSSTSAAPAWIYYAAAMGCGSAPRRREPGHSVVPPQQAPMNEGSLADGVTSDDTLLAVSKPDDLDGQRRASRLRERGRPKA